MSSCPGLCKTLELDQRRAGALHRFGSSHTTTADEPLVIDLVQPGTFTARKHWIIEHLCFTALCTARQPVNGVPVNGLFLCSPGTPDVETFAQASTGDGIILAARPIALPVQERAIPSETLPSGKFAVAITLAPGFKLTVPSGWFLRAILNCAPGTLTPGPGAGSSGQFIGTFDDEENT